MIFGSEWRLAMESGARGRGRAGASSVFSPVLWGICILGVCVEVHSRSPACPTGFAVFGDSFQDTGNIADAFPFALNIENPPYGETYFGRPAKRFSDGRLVADFFSLAFHYPPLDPYFKLTTYDYRTGINFAESAATALPRATALNPFSFIPFQLSQFRRFVGSVAETQANSANCGPFLQKLPSGSSYLSDWLYIIEIGGNDVLQSNITSPEGTQYVINTTIPEVVGAISLGVKQLYAEGARNFLVSGIFTPDTPYRASILNSFNVQILPAIGDLRATLNGSHIAFFDFYAAFQDIVKNAASYGFTSLPPNICCGSYNFTTITCGTPGVVGCPNPNEYLYWDGVHFTDAFYRIIAEFALAGKFTDGGVSYTDLCNLDFSKFGPKATFQSSYPATCDSFFT